MEFFRMPIYYENSFWRIVSNLVWGGVILFAVAVLVIIGTLFSKPFLTFANLENVLFNLLTVGLIASVMVIIFSNGGLDLSVGAVMSLVSIVVALVLQQGSNPVNAVLWALSISLFIGLVNGVLVGVARLPGVLVTLAMMSLVQGISYSLSKGSSITFTVSDSLFLTNLKIVGWVLFILFALVAALSVQFPVLGRRVGLKRPDESQSWLVRSCFLGIPYILSSLLAGYVGLLQTSRLSVGASTLGTGFEIYVILAVVLGGSCIGCYFGNVIGALFGALFFATLQTILALTEISFLHRQFITGALFLIATGFCYGYNGLVSKLYRKESQSESKQA